jgi:hypothetical protein
MARCRSEPLVPDDHLAEHHEQDQRASGNTSMAATVRVLRRKSGSKPLRLLEPIAVPGRMGVAGTVKGDLVNRHHHGRRLAAARGPGVEIEPSHLDCCGTRPCHRMHWSGLWSRSAQSTARLLLPAFGRRCSGRGGTARHVWWLLAQAVGRTVRLRSDGAGTWR